MRIYKDVQQGSAVWATLRAGIVTMSNLHKIITPTRWDLSTQADAYMDSLIAELFYQQPLDGYQSDAMLAGVEMEEESANTFALINDVTVERIGFVTNDAGNIGCSPDRFIVERPNEMLECKCPAPHTHAAYLRTKDISKEYWCQLQGELWICEKEKVHIISYDRKMPLVQMEVGRNDKFIARAEIFVKEFNERFALERAKHGLPDRLPIPPGIVATEALETRENANE